MGLQQCMAPYVNRRQWSSASLHWENEEAVWDRKADHHGVGAQVNGVASAGSDAGKFRGEIHDCHYQILP